LPLFALVLPTARRASATPPDTEAETKAAAVVEKKLVKPLAEKEAKRSHFSRSYVPPQARRVRILDQERSKDGRGAEFVAFAIDERSGTFAAKTADDPARWRKDAIVGCVYPASDEIFIRRGDKYFGAGLLLGQKVTVDATVCRPAPTVSMNTFFLAPRPTKTYITYMPVVTAFEEAQWRPGTSA